MTNLDQAAIDFFRTILATGRDILGHQDFVFKIDATIGSRPEDADRAKLIGLRIQDALNIAKEASMPLTIEGTTLQ